MSYTDQEVIDLFGKIVWNPTQEAALNDPKRSILAQGGWGSGKSTWLQGDMLQTTLDNPGIPVLIVRKTYDMIIDSVIPDLEEKFTSPYDTEQLWPPEILKGGSWARAFSINDRRPVLEFEDGGVWHFRGATHEGKEDPTKFGSKPFGAVGMEEFSDFKSDKTFKYLDGRLRWFNPANKHGYNRFSLAGNPPENDRHWSQEEFVHKVAKDPRLASLRSYYRMPTDENWKHLPEEYIENLKQYSKAWQRKYREGHCGIIEEGTPVLVDVFHPETPDGKGWHVSDVKLEPVQGVPVWRGWDFGVAYMSVVWAQFHPELNQFIVHMEVTERQTSALHFGRKVKMISAQMFPGCRFIDYGDPAGVARSAADKRSPFKVLNSIHKIRVISAPTNDFEKRKDSFIEFMSRLAGAGMPLFCISQHEGTEFLQEALELGWAFPENKEGFIMPAQKPKKNQYSHAADALGYILVSLHDKIQKNRNPRELLRRSKARMNEASAPAPSDMTA